LRAAASDVAAPTASAAFPYNPRRLTARSPLLLGSLDITHPEFTDAFRIVKIAHWSTRGIRLRALRKPSLNGDDLAIGTAPAFSLEISQSHIAHRSLQLSLHVLLLGRSKTRKCRALS